MRNHECWRTCPVCVGAYDARVDDYCCKPPKKIFQLMVFSCILLLILPIAGFSQGSIYLVDLEPHPKTTPWGDSLGIIEYDQVLGEYTHFTYKDQDNQTLTFSFSGNQINWSIEDGNSGSTSLASLEEVMELRAGNQLCHVGTTNCISLAPYLDNTDERIDSLGLASGILTLYTTNGPKAINITDPEEDPIFLSHIAATILPEEKAAWNNHVSNDNDLDNTNELQALTRTLVAPDRLLLDGSILPDGPFYLEVILDDTYVVEGSGGGPDDQFLFFDNSTDTLSIDGGNEVYLGELRQSEQECETITVSTATITSPVTLNADTDKIDIRLNGIGATYVAVAPTHANQILINGQNITFHNEATTYSYSARICSE